MFRVIFGILAIVLLCGFSMAQYGSPVASQYAEPAYGANVPVPVGSERPMPMPMRPMYPVCPQPQATPIVIQSANDTAMLEAVRQGKDFRLEITLRDPMERQYRENMVWQGQYQQQPYSVAPYSQQSCTQYRQRGEQAVNRYGQVVYFYGYDQCGREQWVTYTNQNRCGW